MKKPLVDWAFVFANNPKLVGEVTAKWLERIAKLKGRKAADVKRIYYQAHKNRDFEQYKTPSITTNKKEGVFHWREILKPIRNYRR